MIKVLILIGIIILTIILVYYTYTSGFNKGYDEGISNISLKINFNFTDEELDYIVSKLKTEEDIEIEVKNKKIS